MYNTDLPKRADLPSSGKLLRSTGIAAAIAAGLLVTTVLPADYGIDPTGIGKRLGLTQMGEIKNEKAAEAAADRAATAENSAPAVSSGSADISQLSERIAALENSIQQLIAVNGKGSVENVEGGNLQNENGAQASLAVEEPPAPAPIPEPQVEEPPAPAPEVQAEEPQTTEDTQTAVIAKPATKADQVSFRLTPGEGIEIKLVMKKDAEVAFKWESEGGPVNFDLHADGPGQPSLSYEKGRGVDSKEGVLKAAYDGNHGWFWRNRGEQDVKVTLLTEGSYSKMKGVPPQQ
jgi:hypothetical protein